MSLITASLANRIQGENGVLRLKIQFLLIGATNHRRNGLFVGSLQIFHEMKQLSIRSIQATYRRAAGPQAYHQAQEFHEFFHGWFRYRSRLD